MCNNYTTTTKALKSAGVTEYHFRNLEKAWRARFGGPLGITVNHQGYRQFTPDWIAWLREAVPMHRSGAGMLELSMELRPPAWQRIKLAAPGLVGWAPEL